MISRGFHTGRLVLLGALACAATFDVPVRGAVTGQEDSIGQPTSVTILPSDAVLQGRRATRQLIATGHYENGTLRDLTRDLEWLSLDPQIAEVNARGQVSPRADGEATIVARRGSVEVRTTVKVQGMGEPSPVSFRFDVVPALSQASCNMGACHGTPTGKGGFRLSLRGYLPDQDYEILSRETAGRRITPFAADESLLLRKPLGEVPHEGGVRLAKGTKSHELIRDWIAEGARNDPNAPRPVALEFLPGDRVLNAPANTQQTAVVVRYEDGSTRDVTPICYFETSNSDVAEVDASGYVRFKKRGEVAVIAHYLDLVGTFRLTHLVEVPGFQVATVPTDNIVDKPVFEKLNKMRIAPSEVCTDEEYIRRVYLDTIGVLPTPEEVDRFLADTSPTKREAVVESLLDRPEFYDFWTLKFADVLRSNSRLIKPKGAYAFHRWIRSELQRDAPIDQLVRDLLSAEGSSFANPAANYFRISRTPEDAVETTAQLFLGVRIQCAKCHNHPFEKWTQDDYYGFAAFFSRVKQKKGALPDDEIVFASDGGEVTQPRTGKVMKPKALGGPVLEDTADAPKRPERLAKWLTSPENPFFAKSLVNRVWYHLMGRGIVEPVDDFRDSNPASNDELLNALAADFSSNGYSLKRLIRIILTSRTYQLSARTNELNADDEQYFSHAFTRLLPAEVLLDAISTLTNVPTSFGSLPGGTRATQIPDGQIDNSFLKTFGRPARELACECERESDSNLSQALQLIGGSTVHDKLRADQGRMASLAGSGKTPEEITRELYRVAFSRNPTESELAAATQHLRNASDLRQAVEDLGWVLINSKEFLFRH